jgi:O-antigen/teichoic acid export membrane protein
MSYTKQVVHGSFFYFIGAVLAAGIAYLTKLVLVRNLTVEEYGLFFSVFTFVLFFAVFRELGLSQGLARFVADYNMKGKFGEIKSIIIGSALIQLVVSLVVVALMWVFSGWLAEHYFKAEEAKWLLRIVSFYLPLSIINVNVTSILQGLKSKWYHTCQLIYNLLVLCLILIGLYLGLNLFGPAIAYTVASLLFLIVFIYPLIINLRLKNVKIKKFVLENKKLVLFGLPLILTASGSLFISYFDTLMLTFFHTSFEVGIYNIIYPTALLVTMIGYSIGAIMLPVITELWEKKQILEIIESFKILYKYLVISILPIVLVLWIFSEDLIRILFGQEYLFGLTAFKVLLIAAIFHIILNINHITLIALKEPNKVMATYLFGGFVNVSLNLILIPLFSLNGAAIATSLSFFFMMLLSFYYSSSKIKFKLNLKQIGFITILSALIPLFALTLPIILVNLNIYLSVFIGLILGGLIYLGILFYTKTIYLKEILNLIK